MPEGQCFRKGGLREGPSLTPPSAQGTLGIPVGTGSLGQVLLGWDAAFSARTPSPQACGFRQREKCFLVHPDLLRLLSCSSRCLHQRL